MGRRTPEQKLPDPRPPEYDPNYASLPSSAAWPREAPVLAPLGVPWQPADDLGDLASPRSAESADAGIWIDRLTRAGVAARRLNSPDLIGQLNQSLLRPIDTVLCGALDVDPAACLNSALAARFPVELAAGMALLGRITRATRATVVTDTRVPRVWHERLRRFCEQASVTVEPIVNDYPQADPTLLLYSMLGRRLRPGRLPAERGAVLIDAVAAIAVGRCALLDEAVTQAPLAVRDHVLDRSHYVLAPTGIPFNSLFERLGVPTYHRIIRGGDLLRDNRLPPDAEVSAAGELIIHTALPQPAVNPTPCIRCGWCVDACPTNVHPATALEASQYNDVDLAERAGIEACIECGICTYVCPSRLPLLEGIRRIRGMHRQALTAPL